MLFQTGEIHYFSLLHYRSDNSERSRTHPVTRAFKRTKIEISRNERRKNLRVFSYTKHSKCFSGTFYWAQPSFFSLEWRYRIFRILLTYIYRVEIYRSMNEWKLHRYLWRYIKYFHLRFFENIMEKRLKGLQNQSLSPIELWLKQLIVDFRGFE